MSAKCPSCKNIISNVRGDRIEINMTNGATWRGVSYACQHCGSLLSAQVDPMALMADVVSQLKREIQVWSSSK